MYWLGELCSEFGFGKSCVDPLAWPDQRHKGGNKIETITMAETKTETATKAERNMKQSQGQKQI